MVERRGHHTRRREVRDTDYCHDRARWSYCGEIRSSLARRQLQRRQQPFEHLRGSFRSQLLARRTGRRQEPWWRRNLPAEHAQLISTSSPPKSRPRLPSPMPKNWCAWDALVERGLSPRCPLTIAEYRCMDSGSSFEFRLARRRYCGGRVACRHQTARSCQAHSRLHRFARRTRSRRRRDLHELVGSSSTKTGSTVLLSAINHLRRAHTSNAWAPASRISVSPLLPPPSLTTAPAFRAYHPHVKLSIHWAAANGGAAGGRYDLARPCGRLPRTRRLEAGVSVAVRKAATLAAAPLNEQNHRMASSRSSSD